MPSIPNTSFVLLDTGFLANAQLTNNLTAMLNAAVRPGTILLIPEVVYLELIEGWPVTRQQLDAYRAANPGDIEIWEASRYGGTKYVVDAQGRLPSNAADNALGELYRHLQGEGYSPGQIDIYSDNTKISEMHNPVPNTRGNVPIMRDAAGDHITPVTSSDALKKAIDAGTIDPVEAADVAARYQAHPKPGVFDQAWPETDPYTRQLPDGTVERVNVPRGYPPAGDGWMGDAEARAMSPDVAQARANAEAAFEAEAARIRNDPASYDAEGRYTPQAAAEWTIAYRALAVLGLGLGLYDSVTTGQRIRDLLSHGDVEGAVDEGTGLLGRLLGGFRGAAFGSKFGILGMIGGGIGGAIVGDTNLRLLVDAAKELLRAIKGDPIILDLDGDGIELIALAGSAVRFDMDDDGVAERTGWVSPHDGLLVHDANANGLADGIGELFGSANADGYDELATLDSNADGRIDASDAAFAELMVWRDLNGDGEATADEMLTLAQAGIAANDNDLWRKTAA